MSDAAAPLTPGRRILVADDDQDSAESLAMLFQMMGHEVRSALNGLEAIDVAAVVLAPGAVAVGALKGGQDVVVRDRPRGRSLRPDRRAAKQGRE